MQSIGLRATRAMGMQLRARVQKRAFAATAVGDEALEVAETVASVPARRRKKVDDEAETQKENNAPRANAKKTRTNSKTEKAPIPIIAAAAPLPPVNAVIPLSGAEQIVQDEAKIVYQYGHLVPGRLIKRYKRFLADIELIDADSVHDDDGPVNEANVVTVYCPNTGPMVGLLDLPNARVQLSKSDDPKRKYQYTLEMIQVDNGERRVWVGVHSALANRMVETALASQWFSELAGFTSFQREVKFAKNSRVDFVLSATDGDVTRRKYVEVKSVSFAHPVQLEQQQQQQQAKVSASSLNVDDSEPAGDTTSFCALFPDTISTRAQKHVEELTELITGAENTTATIIFLVQRDDCHHFAPSFLHDIKFAALCDQAAANGVELLAYSCALEPQEAMQTGHVRLLRALPRYTRNAVASPPDERQ
ncbi:Sugar fermentation stimulation protein, partial [Globisporangium splendens]